MLAAPVCAASVFDIARLPFYSVAIFLSGQLSIAYGRSGATSALTLLRVHAVLPVGPDEPEKADNEHDLDAQLEAVKDGFEVRVGVPVAPSFMPM